MNKRGFTLIEMLAVIVILGLLVAFLFPAVTKYIIQTRDNTYTLYEADMKTAAQNMMNECVEENKANCLPKDGLKKRLTLSELVSTGYTDRLKDPKKESEECDPFQSFVTVRNDDSNITNLTYDVCLVCGEYKSNYCDSDEAQEIITETGCTAADDETPPVCGVAVGTSDIWTNKDKEIIIGCSDDCTGCVQDTFTKVINTDTKTTTIDIADNAGKVTACPVDAYVDKTKPTCTLEVTGTIGDNGWYKAGTRPKVTLKTKTDPQTNGVSSGLATYGIGTSKSNYDFNKETEYLVEDGVTVVYGYVKDNAGNIGVCHTEEIRYDSVIPTIDSVDYGTIVYPKADIAEKNGATITLNNITSEYGTIYGFYIYMNNGYGGTVTVKNGSTTLRSSLTIPSATSKLKNYLGTAKSYNNLSFTFGSETEANNVSRIELLTRNDSGYYTNQNVTLYINSLDSVSGKADYSFDNGSTYSEDNFNTYTQLSTVKMKVTDYAGNVSNTTTKNITNIDKVQPQCTVTFGSSSVTVHENNYFWANVPVTLTKDDSAATSQYTKSNTRYYGLKNTSGLEYNNTATGTQSKDTTGHIWYGYVIDKAGNTKDCNATVKKDTQNPTCTLTKSGTVGVEEWYRSNVTISFSNKEDLNKDGVQSGLVYYQIDTSSGNPSTWRTSNSNTQTTDTSGTTWYGHVKDAAGHTARCEITVKRDTVLPVCTISSSGNVGNNGWYVSNVSITLSYKADNQGTANSGLYQYGIGSYNSSTSATQSSDTTGTRYVGMVKDKAGNENTCSGTVKKDTVAPTCGVSLTSDQSTTGVGGSITCTDSTSGCVGTPPSFSGLKAPITADPTGQVRQDYSYVIGTLNHGPYTIKDNAGHSTDCSVKVYSYCLFKSDAHPDCGSYYTKTSKYCGRTYHPEVCHSGTVWVGHYAYKDCSYRCRLSANFNWTPITDSNCDGSEKSGWDFCETTSSGTKYWVDEGSYTDPCKTKDDAYYTYAFGSPSTSYNNTSCSNNNISCTESNYGSYHVACTWTSYQTCRTVANGCQTYYYRYHSTTPTHNVIPGNSGGGDCSGSGAYHGGSNTLACD